MASLSFLTISGGVPFGAITARVERGDYNIADRHLADAIAEMTRERAIATGNKV